MGKKTKHSIGSEKELDLSPVITPERKSKTQTRPSITKQDEFDEPNLDVKSLDVVYMDPDLADFGDNVEELPEMDEEMVREKLQSLEPSVYHEIRSFKDPPIAVVQVIACAALLLGE